MENIGSKGTTIIPVYKALPKNPIRGETCVFNGRMTSWTGKEWCSVPLYN